VYLTEGISGSPLMAFAATLLEVEYALVKPGGADPKKTIQAASEARAVEIFLNAVLDGTRVRFTYRSPYRAGGAAAQIEAEPFGLLWDRDRWYLIGRRIGARQGADQRLWRADRVGEIAASTMRATPAPSFDVRRQLGRAWLRDAMAQWARSSPVKIRLRRQQAERLATDWYFRFARFDEIAADEIVMTYGEYDAAKAFELVRWLGPGAELLAPAEWRAQLGAELRGMADAYGGAGLAPARGKPQGRPLQSDTPPSRRTHSRTRRGK